MAEEERRAELQRRVSAVKPQDQKSSSPFARQQRNEPTGLSKKPWNADQHPSVAHAGTGLWARTGLEHRSIVSQLSHGQTDVSSVHQMLIRRAPTVGPHFEFVHRFDGHVAELDRDDAEHRNRPSLFAALR